MSDQSHAIMILANVFFLVGLASASAYEQVYKKNTFHYRAPLFVGLVVCAFYWTEVLTRAVLNATSAN